MTYSPGSFGRIRIFEDFLGNYVTADPTTTFSSVGLLGAISVSAGDGSCTSTVDEPGGVICVNTHTDDNDNAALFAGVFKPVDGGCVMETRFKVASPTTCAIFAGFTETLAVTTPVCPAEFATATLTCNGSGSMVGMLHDADATTDIWMAVAGDGGVEETVYNASEGPTADEWDVVRVEIGSDGKGICMLNGRVIHTFTSFLTTTDIQHAVLFVENRSGAANALEVDYFYAEGFRDWTRA